MIIPDYGVDRHLNFEGEVEEAAGVAGGHEDVGGEL